MRSRTLEEKKYVKSPLNYIGGKGRLLKQILPLFPSKIENFVDLFAGGFNVGINVNASKVYANDNLSYLIEMFQFFQKTNIEIILIRIENRIKQFDLSLTNEDGFRALRMAYNKGKNPIDLFVLIAFSFNHQIRFNSNHQYNNPFGRNRSSFNEKMKQNLIAFIIRLKEIVVEFSDKCFTTFDYSFLGVKDFVYCDPPYLITTGTYNDGKRGFKGWGKSEEDELLLLLNDLDKKGVRFALSNVIEHKGKTNEQLKLWVDRCDFHTCHLNFNYANSNYQTLNRKKESSKEVLITNYKIPRLRTLFDS